MPGWRLRFGCARLSSRQGRSAKDFVPTKRQDLTHCVVSALADKAHDLRSAITTFEELLAHSRHELAVVTATLSLFQRGDDRLTDHRPAHVRNLFRRGEPLRICKAALEAEPNGMTMRELAAACLAARKIDREDPALVRAISTYLLRRMVTTRIRP